MKHLILFILCFCTISLSAQVVGNRQIETKTYALEQVYRINIQMYAKVTVDMSLESGISITGESNLLDLVQQNVSGGVLTLDQKKWIEPTQDLTITIGAPGLREVEMGTHDKTIVNNITGNIFKVEAPIGEVVLNGKVQELRIKSKMGRVDASNLVANNADIRIKSDGEVSVNVSNLVECDLNEDASFVNVNPSAKLSDCQVDTNNDIVEDGLGRYINLKIKNNSMKRNHFVVVGPKPNGRRFSYGFALMPLQSKKERWTVGTKIYKENSVGIRTLLVMLTEDDEDQTVKLFN